ncbi:CIA30 family protein [Geoalkalibacter halelectricus]|uniref:CIA30 family protein n=1 Tax=Geoalkalibacter halelectricus TaxID=2847045 RepID=A0ABY5ZPD0_9BACT|nr:CIA30 family protein [Geoalkalibacter halelectricus]MDO3380112.1 CIA30 family protein [Geoalkalibacter halelectricus]UWZ80369.1 CIA30 family protein [Geoalkalibacter halelectricus]
MVVQVIFDFLDPDVIRGWYSIDDVVMGGRSRSQVSGDPAEGMIFSGTLSLENGGGFASIRSAVGSYDLGRASGVQLVVRGDGLRYKLSLRCDSAFDGIAYQAGFATRRDEIQTIPLPWTVFAPSYHGRVLPDAPSLNPARIRSFGFLCAERRPGPFRLAIRCLLPLEEEWNATASGDAVPGPADPGEN